MMKKVGVLLAVVLAVTGLASATSKEFSMGHFYLTPQVGFASWGGMPFGLNAEYAISENIGVGGTAMAQFWSYGWGTASWVTIAANGNYHFVKLAADKIDLYIGAELGYGLYSFSYASGWNMGATGTSGLSLAAVAGGRYFFSPKIAVSVRFTSPFLGSYTGFGGAIGVTFVLK